MTDEPQQDRQLEALLDRVGQWCQPQHPGWETLLERLGPQQAIEEAGAQPAPSRQAGEGQPGQTPRRSRVRRYLTLAAGAFLAVTLAGLLFLVGRNAGLPRAAAANLDVEVQRRGIQVTVFSPTETEEPTLFMPVVGWPAGGGYLPGAQGQMQQRFVSQAAQIEENVQVAQVPGLIRRRPPNAFGPAGRGMGLVKDQRMVLHLKEGDNIVKFTDVAAAIDPTSVRLVSDTDPLGTQVVEQNFEFDLASAETLLERSLDHRVACVGKDEQPAAEGLLLSYDADTLVLADRAPEPDPKAPRPKTQAVARKQLKAIRLEEVPKNLYTRPTLVWKLRTKRPGDHLTTLTYLCGNMVWQADYVATIVSSDPDAGDVLDLTGWVTIDNRSGATYEQAGLKLIAGDVSRVRDPWAPLPEAVDRLYVTLFQTVEAQAAVPEGRKEFVAREFFEYKLYALSQPSTIKDQQIKQLGLLQASGIKAHRRFLFDPQKNPERLLIELVVKNEKANGLGRPLPKGRVTFVAPDADGESQFLGRDQIDHTPKDEELELKLGQAFDVVGEAKTLNTQRPSARRLIETYEIRVRNHKDTAIDVRAVGHLHGYLNWQVTQTSDDYLKHDFQTLYFDFRLKPNSEKTITYTVDYQW
jgi:hypothetical protein